MRFGLLFLMAVGALAGDKPDVFVELGHSGGVSAVAFSPDSRMLVSGSEDRTIKFWDLSTGRELRTIASSEWVNDAAFSPDGSLVAAAYGNDIAVLQATTGKLLRTLHQQQGFVRSVAFAPDGKTIVAAGGDKTVKLWDLKSGSEMRTFTGHTGYVNSVAFSPDGRSVFSGGDDKTVRQWDTATGREMRSFQGHTDEVRCVSVAPDGLTMISSAADKAFRHWDISTGKELRNVGEQTRGSVRCAVSHDSKRVLSSRAGEVALWDLASGEKIGSFKGTGGLSSIAFTPDGMRIATGSQDGELKIWDVSTGEERQLLSAGRHWVEVVAIAPHGRSAASAGRSGIVPLWDLVNGRLLDSHKVSGYGTESLAFSPDGKLLASASGDFQVWDLASNGQVRVSGRGFFEHDTIRFTSDSRQAIAIGQPDSGDNRAIQAWKLSSDAPVANLKVKGRGGSAITSGGKVLVGTHDRKLLLIDPFSGRRLRSFPVDPYPYLVASSPDDRLAASGGDGDVRIWNLHTGEELSAIEPRFPSCMTFSPDSRFVVTGSNQGLSLWEAASGKLVRTFEGHQSWVSSAVFSPDGKTILSGGADGTARLWNTATGKELVKMVSFGDGEWIVITPEGYYNASPKGDQHLSVRIGGVPYGVDQWRSTFYKPAVVEATLRLQDSEAAADSVLGRSQTTMVEPPFVIFKSPDDGDRVSSLTTNISVHIEDRHQPIQSVKVLINGRTAAAAGERGFTPIGSVNLPAGLKQHTLRLPVTLKPGENLVEVLAHNGNSEGRASVRLHAAETPGVTLPNLYILGIAVNKYRSPAINALNFAVADVRGIAAAFESQKGKLYGEVHVRILADDSPLPATRENIIDNLGFLRKAGQNDISLLILAGHAQNDPAGGYYFLPTDAEIVNNTDVRPSTAVSWRDIKAVLEGPASKMVMLDTCHAQNATGVKSRNADNDRLVRELRDFGAVVFASSRGTEVSLESTEWGHGAFTYAILQGLKGEANLLRKDVITMKELDTYVSAKVPELTKGAQHPVTYTPEGYVNFPVRKLK